MNGCGFRILLRICLHLFLSVFHQRYAFLGSLDHIPFYLFIIHTHTKNECIQILPFYEHKLLICVLIFTAVTWFRQFFFIIVVIFKIRGFYWRCIDAKECIKQKSSVTFLENASSTSIYRMSI